MLRQTTLLLALLFLGQLLFAQTPNIRVKVDDFAGDTLILANFFAESQFLRDTAVRGKNDWFEFTRDTAYEGGIYLVVMPPDNQYFQIMMDAEQRFSVETKRGEEVSAMKTKGSLDNALFYDYLRYLNTMRPRAEAINARKEGVADETELADIDAELDALNAEVETYQKQVVEQHPTTLTAALIRANQSPKIPEFDTLAEDQRREAQWRWMQRHYFDNIDLGDPRLIRTPFLAQRVNYYVDKLTLQDPDTLIGAIDYVLERVRPARTNFQYFLSNFLNTYAKSKIVGQDAIYVHLVNNYYAAGAAPWLDSETLRKITEEAKKMEPLLIGKEAPDVTLQRQDGTPVRIHDIEADYTVLIFWQPDCPACKKSGPPMLEFAKKYADRGVRTVSICTKLTTDTPKCWEFVEEKGWGTDLLNLADPYHRSRFNVKYNVTGTPRIFILDQDKKILIKGIGADQIDEVMQQIMEREAP